MKLVLVTKEECSGTFEDVGKYENLIIPFYILKNMTLPSEPGPSIFPGMGNAERPMLKN